MNLSIIDLEALFDPDNVITNHQPINTSTLKFTEDGIFSPRIFGSMEAVQGSYSCKCGAVYGKFHVDVTCPKCEEIVKQRSSSLSTLGWIDLKRFYIINPYYYEQLAKLIGNKVLEDIINFKPVLDINGNSSLVEDSKNPYKNLGMFEFRENLREILEYYKKKNKSKNGTTDRYNFLIEYYDYIFISKIPVYSSLLRPATFIGKKFSFAEENVNFCMMIQNSNILNNQTELEDSEISSLPIITEIQYLANCNFEKVIAILSGKTGLLRGSLLGNRINYSVRTVISPLPAGNNKYKIKDIMYPYLAAVELFKFEIINILAMKTCSYLEAQKIWFEATIKFSDPVYKILEEFIQKSKGGISILINRNPTIALGSILSCKIVEIKRDYDDFTMNLSNNILGLISGDFDGDVLTSIDQKDQSYIKHFERLNPELLVVDKNTGRFNKALDFDKDYRLGLETFLS